MSRNNTLASLVLDFFAIFTVTGIVCIFLFNLGG